jgi:hypothetical protein
MTPKQRSDASLQIALALIGQYGSVIEMHEQDRAIREAIGDLVGQVCLS